jgi:hypothetical protein
MRKYSNEVGLSLICLWYALLALFFLANFVSAGMAWLVFSHPEFYPSFSHSIFAAFIILAPVSYLVTMIYLARVYENIEQRKFLNKVAGIRIVGWSLIYFFFLPENLSLIGNLEATGFIGISDLFFTLIVAGLIADIVQGVEWYMQASYLSRMPKITSAGRTN